jgi:hypothetical protein
MINMPPRMVIQQNMARNPLLITTLLTSLGQLITVTFSTPTPVNNISNDVGRVKGVGFLVFVSLDTPFLAAHNALFTFFR